MMYDNDLYSDWIKQQEYKDQVRMTWNLWPSSDQQEMLDMPLPLAVLYSPLGHQSVPLNPYHQLLKCRCGAILNMFCSVDSQKNQWICNFCSGRSYFPEKYNKCVSPSTTEEYVTSLLDIAPPKSSPTILLVLDTNLPGTELKAMMKTVSQAVTELPSETIVGLITIGSKTVNIHQLEGKSSILTSYDFPGQKELTIKQLADQLRLNEPRRMEMFLQPIGACIDKLAKILDTIRSTLNPEKKKRRSRPTGKALSIALNLIENIKRRTRSRILLFVDGPCTFGPGQVASLKLRETMRTHLDIQKNRVPYSDTATTFYKKIALRAQKIDCSIDLFAYAQIEVGLVEMSYCSGYTGGQIYSAESFLGSSFKLNLQAALRRELIIGDSFNVKVSQGLKVRNVLMGDLFALNEDTTIPVFFEIQPKNLKGTGYIQFLTNYGNRLRVTTIARNWVNPLPTDYLAGLDPETAVVILARLAKSQEDPILWLEEQKNKLMSINGNGEMLDYNVAVLSRLIDHLCESRVISTFNISPDESALNGFLFFQSSVDKSLMLIQPRVWSFDPGDPNQRLAGATLPQQHGPPWRIEDSYYRVIVYHDPSIDKLPSEISKKIMENLRLQARNPVPEIMGFKQRG